MVMRYISSPGILLFAAVTLSVAPTSTRTAELSALTVHEWGTFTSIAGADGSAVAWLPQAGPTDLPCFVERNRFNLKGSLSGTVRMETPVLYFYTAREMTVQVDVRFRQGVMTEWFPHAAVTPAGGSTAGSASTLTWHNVTVSPGAAEDFPVEHGASHYYAARRTAATPLRSGSEMEKFLFYRGVGRFLPPITATVDGDGQVSVTTPADQPVGDVILFRNVRGRKAYEVRRAADGQVTVDPQVVDQEPASELERLLLAQGLYPDEASAMLDTWRDSWFEEGTRLIYIVPRREIDRILPLQITPAPTEVARVFVGRMELVTPDMLKTIKAALLASDAATLRAYGRFLEPIGRRIVAESSRDDRALLQRRLNGAYATMMAPQDACVSAATTSERR